MIVVLGRAAGGGVSECDDAFDHDALELPAAADVARRKIEILLVNELDLREHVRRDEPSSAELRAPDRDVVRDSRQLTLHRVVASADVELVPGESVESLADELPQGATLNLVLR